MAVGITLLLLGGAASTMIAFGVLTLGSYGCDGTPGCDTHAYTVGAWLWMSAWPVALVVGAVAYLVTRRGRSFVIYSTVATLVFTLVGLAVVGAASPS